MALKLTVNNLSFNYSSVSVLKEVNFEVGVGDFLSIIGPNGSGKSTLLKCINRVLNPAQNTILIDGKDTSTIKLNELCKIMGYVPQSSSSVFPYTVFDVVLMGRKPYLSWNLSEKDSDIVAEILEFLDICDLAMRHFNELSGGEQQKVIIARALAQQPQILLLDEPTSSLDVKYQLEIMYILKSLAETIDRSIIVSMHDLNMASRFSDKLIMLKKGKIFAAGSPKEVLTEENIEAVYDIGSKVTESFLDKPQVIPVLSELSRVKTLKVPMIFKT